MIISEHDLNKEIFIVAEIGNNHEGSFQTALELVDAASSTGVNAIKFQTCIPEKFYASSESNRIQTLKNLYALILSIFRIIRY